MSRIIARILATIRGRVPARRTTTTRRPTNPNNPDRLI